MITGCNNMMKANDLCAMHYQRSLRHDGFTGETRAKRGVCTVSDCDGGQVAKGLCQKHYYRLQRTGTTEDPIRNRTQGCSVVGCKGDHVARGLCGTHYKRMERHGDVVQTRSVDWGAREKHPLYATWTTLLRFKSDLIVSEWRDLWAFVKDMGDSRPSSEHTLQRLNDDKPFGPGNVYWRENCTSGRSEDQKALRASYMKAWYKVNKRTVLNADMMKRYGIGYDRFEEMLAEQNGVCAICGKEETRVDHRTKQVSRLAIDHDHKTGTVRGLLCHAHNNSLGHFNDNPMVLWSAIKYLAKHSDDAKAVFSVILNDIGDLTK
jgi:hypothetical protein